MTNKLYVGSANQIDIPRSGLLIHDDVPDAPRARVFDPAKHSFNPLKDITYKDARQMADVLYRINPQGQDTLTVRNGKRGLLRALLAADRLDKIRPEKDDDEVAAMIDDLLLSPVLRRVLCNPTNFSFNPRSLIFARINRSELGEFDALVLGLFLMSHFKGQLIVPDFGFYGREGHQNLIREGRLIAGVNFLSELPPTLRQSVLLVKEKIASGATYDDAVLLAKSTQLLVGTNAFNEYVGRAVESS